MLGRTHTKIAQKIAELLGIEKKRDVNLLVSGSINPDSWCNFPHHCGKEQEISENIPMARRLFLLGDDECYHRLGIALHFIADKWSLRPRMKDKHTESGAAPTQERLENTRMKLKHCERIEINTMRYWYVRLISSTLRASLSNSLSSVL